MALARIHNCSMKWMRYNPAKEPHSVVINDSQPDINGDAPHGVLGAGELNGVIQNVVLPGGITPARVT